MKPSKEFLNCLNKTRGISEFNAYHDFYIYLQVRKAQFQKYYVLGSHHFYGKANKTDKKYGTKRENMSTVTNEGV